MARRFITRIGARVSRFFFIMAGRYPLTTGDAQMMFFLGHGYRVIAHDRRGHGRSTQTVNGNDMDTYAADAAELANALDLNNAIHIGHSTGGGEATRYVAQHGKGRVAKA